MANAYRYSFILNIVNRERDTQLLEPRTYDFTGTVFVYVFEYKASNPRISRTRSWRPITKLWSRGNFWTDPRTYMYNPYVWISVETETLALSNCLNGSEIMSE